MVPFFPPLPRLGEGTWPPPGRGGRTDSRELRAAAWCKGGCKREEGGSWPLPSPSRKKKAGRPMEGCKWRIAEPHTLRVVIYYLHQWSTVFLS